jgi:hypothetical protein
MRHALFCLAAASFALAVPAAAQPPAPTALTARSISASQIDLTWQGASNGKQVLHAATNAGFTGGVKRTLGADVRAFAHTGLAGSTTWWYRVKSNGDGGSPWSLPANATTAPAGVAVRSLSSASLEISWTPNPANSSIDGYTVRYGTAPDFAGGLTEYHWAGDRTVGTYVAAGLAPGGTYYVAVKAEGSPDSAFSASASVTLPGGGVPISRVFFGQNAWMPEWVGLAHKWGDLEQLLCGADYVPGAPCEPAEVQASGVQVMRYGGKSVDKNWDDGVSPGQYLTMVDNLRANGIEPILQVPYHDGAFAPGVAAALVAAINGAPNARDVRYWSVGNEPNDVYPQHATAAGIADYFRTYVPAMRAVDPDIAVVGPDLSWFDLDIMAELMEPGGASDICGSYTAADGTTQYYLDVVAFHTYPFHGGNQDRDAVIAFPTGSFEARLEELRGLVDACNDAHHRTGAAALRTAVTEINVEYTNAPLGIGGLGAQSFLGGQFWAEVMSVGMKHGLELMTFWSVKEGGPQLGYIASDGTRLPSYYHFQMLAKNFRGDYLPGTALVNGAPSPHVKAFAARDADQTVVMILNQDETQDLAYTVRLDGGAVAGPSALKVNLDAGLAREYTPPAGELLPAQGTVLLVFDAAGDLRERHAYDVTFGPAPPVVHPD